MRFILRNALILSLQILTAMKHVVNTEWLGDMKFDSLVNGHHVIVDAMPEGGGHDTGPRPKTLLLTALAGCTGMDVVSILKKMRVEVERFHVEVAAEMTEEHPRHYTHMHIIYRFAGKDLPLDKLEKAIELSQERYCGVSFMFRKAMEITHEIVVE
jgi:putative redox protein